MKKKILVFFIIMSVFMSGCTGKEEMIIEKNKEEAFDSGKNILAKDYTGEGGYVIQSNVLDYSQCFDKVYEWTLGVKLPIDKPDNVKIELSESYLQISEFTIVKFENYLKSLEGQGYKLKKYEEKNEVNEQLNYMAYVVYKENIVVLFENIEGVINVFVTVGNVVGERSVEASRVIELLGEDYSDNIILEVSYDSVHAEEYCEFIVIPPEYFSAKSDRPKPKYVIANCDKVLLCEEGLWNQVYPMTVNLIKKSEKQELYINYNDLPWSRSGASVYPVLRKYELKEGVFKEYESINLTQDKVIIGKQQNEGMKYYILKENEEFDLKEGRRTYWIIDKEYYIEE